MQSLPDKHNRVLPHAENLVQLNTSYFSCASILSPHSSQCSHFQCVLPKQVAPVTFIDVTQ